MLRLSIFLILIYSVLFAQTWKFENIYDGEVNARYQLGKTFLYRSNDLTTHIFYGGDHLYHLKYDNGSWNREIVDNNDSVGRNISSALASDGSLHVSYIDDEKLRYATKAINSNTWEITQTQHFASADKTSICVDDNNISHIFYRYINDIYYTRSDTLNQTEVFVRNAFMPTVVCDAQTGVHVAYRSLESGMQGLWYANNHSGNFVHRRIYNTDDAITRISIDASSQSGKKAIAIIYYHEREGFAKFFDTTVDNYNTSWSTSIAYEADSDVSVKVSATIVSTAFSVIDSPELPPILKLVQKDNTGTRISDMLNDSHYYGQINLEYINNFLRVKYYDYISNTIEWAYKNATQEWKKETIRDFNIVGNFFKVDMKIYNNVPKITFKTPHNGLQYFSKSSQGTWNASPFNSTTLFDPKLSTIKNGFIETWLQYINTETYALERVKYAHYYDGLFSGWRWYRVDESNSINDTNISIGQQYHDVTTYGFTTHSCYVDNSFSLFYISADNEGWNQPQELSVGAAGATTCKIAVDAQEKVHIVYTNLEEHLFYITNETGAWISEEILLNGKQKINQQLIVSKGIVHIGFFNKINHTVEYIKSSNYTPQTPRSWPPSSQIVINSDHIPISRSTAFDMAIDKDEKIYFAAVYESRYYLENKLYLAKENSNGFEAKITDLDFNADGLKLAVSDDTLHVMLLNKDSGDVIYGSSKTTTPLTPVIMYLLF